MNILFVNCNFGMLDKIDCGASNRTTLFVKALTQFGHVDVINFWEEVTSNVDNCDVVYNKTIWNSSEDTVPLVLIYLKEYRFLINPFNPHYYYNTNKDKEQIIDRRINSKHYDIIACRYIEDAIICGLLKYSDRLVIDVDDNPTNAKLRNMYLCRHSRLRHKIRLWLDAYCTNLMVKHVLSKVRCSFFSNKLEPPYKQSVFLHNTSLMDRKINVITSKTPMSILIVGWLQYFPNKLGVLHFAECIFPMIRERFESVELHIVGKGADEELLKRLSAVDGVKVLGYVDDIVSEYENSRVVIVPVFHGSGTSVKFIEGTTMNRPVVSTPIGSRGFDDIFVEGEDYMKANNDEEFAKKTINLLISIELSNKMASKALEKARCNFSQQNFMDIVKNAISKSFIA